jgi:hypothetical protein
MNFEISLISPLSPQNPEVLGSTWVKLGLGFSDPRNVP